MTGPLSFQGLPDSVRILFLWCMAKARSMIPAWVRTVGAMIDEGIEIRASCDRHCSDWFVVDLEKLRRLKGPDYSLVNRRSRCKTPGCKGWVKFYFPLGVYRPLWDEETDLRWFINR